MIVHCPKCSLSKYIDDIKQVTHVWKKPKKRFWMLHQQKAVFYIHTLNFLFDFQTFSLLVFFFFCFVFFFFLFSPVNALDNGLLSALGIMSMKTANILTSNKIHTVLVKIHFMCKLDWTPGIFRHLVKHCSSCVWGVVSEIHQHLNEQTK